MEEHYEDIKLLNEVWGTQIWSCIIRRFSKAPITHNNSIAFHEQLSF
nr:beta-galactosidase [Paenibacillus castaneae]